MSAPVTILSEWNKNAREVVRVSLDEFNGRSLVSIKVWYRPEDGGDIRPGKAGVAMATYHLPKLATAISEALRIATERGEIAGRQ